MSALADELEPYGELVSGLPSPALLVVGDGFPLKELSKGLGLRYIGDQPALTPDFIRGFLETLSFHTYGRITLMFNLRGTSDAAQTTLLKTVEEGLPGVSIILATEVSWLDRILPTIRSRCFLALAPPPGVGLIRAVLASRGVSEARLRQVGGSYPGSILEAILEYDIGSREPVDNLLRSLETGNTLAALSTAGGMGGPENRLLALLVRRHILGIARVQALAGLPLSLLATWAEILEDPSVPNATAARWGVLEVTGAA
jgi:hypothetical protein